MWNYNCEECGDQRQLDKCSTWTAESLFVHWQDGDHNLYKVPQSTTTVFVIYSYAPFHRPPSLLYQYFTGHHVWVTTVNIPSWETTPFQCVCVCMSGRGLPYSAWLYWKPIPVTWPVHSLRSFVWLVLQRTYTAPGRDHKQLVSECLYLQHNGTCHQQYGSANFLSSTHIYICYDAYCNQPQQTWNLPLQSKTTRRIETSLYRRVVQAM